MMLSLLFMFKKRTVIHVCNIEIFMCMLNAHESLICMNLNKPVYLYRNEQNGLLKAILMSKLCFLGLRTVLSDLLTGMIVDHWYACTGDICLI